MRVWTCMFHGLWPVVVVAENAEQARELLADAVELDLEDDDELVELDTDHAAATVLLDGEY